MGNTVIVGAGLTGSLLAIKIAKKYHNENIYLLDNSNNILSSFKPINLDGKKVNNGFHGLEINRSKKLFFFLKNEIKVKFRKFLIKRSLLINQYFIQNTSYDKFPLELKKNLKKKKFKSKSLNLLFKQLTGNYKKTLEIVSKKYYSKINNSLQLLVPWFLPKEFHYISDDEGDKFRQMTKQKINFFAIPKKNNLFFDISNQFENKLKSYNNIIILKNSTLSIESNNVSIQTKKRTKKIFTNQIFITTMPTFFFKFFNNREKINIKRLTRNKRYFFLAKIKLKKKLNIYFSEILCALKNFIELSRISKISYKKSNNELLFELSYSEKKIDNKIFKHKVSHSLKPIIKDNKIIKIRKKLSRTIFMPNNNDIMECLKVIDKKVNHFRNKGFDITYNRNFAPLNMAKAWLLSEKFYEKADKNLSR